MASFSLREVTDSELDRIILFKGSFLSSKCIRLEKNMSAKIWKNSLVTSNTSGRWQWCWWQRYVGDFMMMTDLRRWWQNHNVGDFFNVQNLSPILALLTTYRYQIGHQHKLSPTSMSPCSSVLFICLHLNCLRKLNLIS